MDRNTWFMLFGTSCVAGVENVRVTDMSVCLTVCLAVSLSVSPSSLSRRMRKPGVSG